MKMAAVCNASLASFTLLIYGTFVCTLPSTATRDNRTTNVVDEQSISPMANETDHLVQQLAVEVDKQNETVSEDPLAKPPLLINPSIVMEIRSALVPKVNTKYDRMLPPDYPFNTRVNVSIWPMSLAHVDERTQTITVQVDVHLFWYDRRLEWPARILNKYNISQEALRRELDLWTLPYNVAVWYPQVVNVEAPSGAGSELRNPRIVGRYDGWMRLRGSYIEERTCQIHAKYFPFDRQCCPLTLATHNMAELHANELDESRKQGWWVRASGLKQDIGNSVQLKHRTGEWIMYENREYFFYALTTNRSTKRFQSDVHLLQYKLILTRRPWQHVLSWIVPPIVLSSSTVYAVFKGCDPSERLSFAATILVTMGVMLDSLREHLAVGTDGYPVLGQLYLGLMLSLVITIVVCSAPERLYPPSSRGRRNTRTSTLFEKLALINFHDGGNKNELGRQGSCSSSQASTVMVTQNFDTPADDGDKTSSSHTTVSLSLSRRTANRLRTAFNCCFCCPQFIRWPAKRAAFRNLLMYGILLLQFGMVGMATVQWLMHPLGALPTWLGIAMTPEEFCNS